MVPTKNSKNAIKKPKVSKKSSSSKVKAIESAGEKVSKKSAPKAKTKYKSVSYTHLRAHETPEHLVSRRRR